MKDDKIHPDLINTVANLYTGNHTVINIGNMDKIKMDISSGIKQGCTASTSLLKVVTFDTWCQKTPFYFLLAGIVSIHT